MQDPSGAPVATEDRGRVRVLRMQHGKANALDLELCEALIQAMGETSGVDAVVLTGTGSMFSAGVDLVRVVEGGPAYVSELLPLLSEAFRRLALAPGPVVAAVNGHAVAGGFILLAAADRAVAAPGGARLGTTELLVGVPFPAVARELLVRRAGRWASEMAYLGDTCDVDTALERGLVDEVSAAPVDRAVELADRMAAAGPAFALTKRHLGRSLRAALEARREDEDREVGATWVSEAALERVRRYVEATLRRPRP